MWSYSPFCHKFRSHCNEGLSGKNSIGSIRWPIHKTPLQMQKSRRYLSHRPSYSSFCPKFRCHGNGDRSGKCDLQHSIAHPRKPFYRRKNIADMSYARRVITNFVPNFVAMATGVGRGKMQLAAFDGPSLNTPLQAQKSPTQAELQPILSQISLPWQPGRVRGKII